MKQATSMVRSVGHNATEQIREQGRDCLPGALLTLQRAIAEVQSTNPVEIKSLKLEWAWTSPNTVDWTVTVERHTWTCNPVIVEEP